MLVGIQREIDGQRQGHSPPPVPDKVAERDVDAAAAELEREAESLRIPKAPEIAPPPSRRSIPVSMPVARDVPTMNGKRMSQSTTVTLSKDEREIAHSAYNWLSKGEAEREYATHKFRMLEARKNGTLNE